MARFFNTAGPCLPDRHYMLPPERRIGEMRTLIERGQFFVLHAPRQTGKTTLLNALAASLQSEGRLSALVVSVEFLRGTTDVVQGNIALAHRIHTASQVQLPHAEQPPDPAAFETNPLSALHDFLAAWAAACPK